MTKLEARIFARLADAVVAPVWPLPPVAETDATVAFSAYLASCPRRGRIGLGAALLALELGPLALGLGRPMSALAPARRGAYLERVRGGRAGAVVQALIGLAHLFYYGDGSVMAAVGYDAGARVARGRRLRAAEGRW